MFSAFKHGVNVMVFQNLKLRFNRVILKLAIVNALLMFLLPVYLNLFLWVANHNISFSYAFYFQLIVSHYAHPRTIQIYE